MAKARDWTSHEKIFWNFISYTFLRSYFILIPGAGVSDIAPYDVAYIVEFWETRSEVVH